MKFKDISWIKCRWLREPQGHTRKRNLLFFSLKSEINLPAQCKEIFDVLTKQKQKEQFGKSQIYNLKIVHSQYQTIFKSNCIFYYVSLIFWIQPPLGLNCLPDGIIWMNNLYLQEYLTKVNILIFFFIKFQIEGYFYAEYINIHKVILISKIRLYLLYLFIYLCNIYRCCYF